MAKCNIVYFLVAVILFNGIMCIPEQGIQTLIPAKSEQQKDELYWGVFKSMYAGTIMTLDISCVKDVELSVRWVIRTFKCADSFQIVDEDDYKLVQKGAVLGEELKPSDYLELDSDYYDVKCSPSKKTITLPDMTNGHWQEKNTKSFDGSSTGVVGTEKDESNDDDDVQSQNKDGDGDADADGESKGDESASSDGDPETSEEQNGAAAGAAAPSTTSAAAAAAAGTTKKVSTKASTKPKQSKPPQTKSRTRRLATESKPADAVKNATQLNATKSDTLSNIPGALIKVPVDGLYYFWMTTTFHRQPADNLTVVVVAKFVSSYGYLSAIDFPFLPFYAVLCAVYAIFLLTWLILCCCYCRDILRIQLWIAAVIFIGFIEEATFLGEYHVLNQTGQSVPGAVHFGELISCTKRALSRVLVIIASVGFGIVKPRLGPTLPKVLGVGIGYFILSAVDGYLRAATHKANHQESSEIVFIGILAVTDAAICWWIFTALIQTTKTLRLRRNLVKLSLYRHFTNTLIFAVIASVGFMLWSIIVHKFTHCLTDWKELWVEDAFWQLLFTIILFVMMVLWRPSASNQRYAYSPLSDGADDDAEEPMMNEAFEGMKMRSSKTDTSYSRKHSTDHVDDDLKWIEDNIPASVADSTLPGLLDSEEEIMNTKYELSKMQ